MKDWIIVVLVGILLYPIQVNGQYTESVPLVWCTPESNIELNEGKVESWSSEFNDFVLSQVEENQRPEIVPNNALIGGYRTVQFNGGAFLDTEVDISYPHTLIVVVRGDVESQSFLYDTPSRLFHFFNSNGTAKAGSLSSHTSTMTQGDFLIISHTVSSGISTINENNIEVASGAETRTINGFLRIGASVTPDRFFTGDIAEIILYNTDLSEIEHTEIIDSLKNKYAPPPDLGPDMDMVADCNVTMSVAPRFKEYSWYSLEDETEILVSQGNPELEVETAGIFILETISIFDEVGRDTVQVSSINISGLADNTICESFGHVIDLEVTDENITIEWSSVELEGSLVEIEIEGDYSVVITQDDGCVYESDVFSIADLEEITAIEYPDILCLGNEITTTVSDIDDLTFEWNTTEVSVSIEPQTSGEYWVEATNANGCVGRDTVDVEIVGVAPTVEMNIGVACATRQVTFADATVPEEGAVVESNWVFGPEPGDIAQGDIVSYIYDVYGVYPVVLDVLLDNGCTGIKRDTVHVKPLPLVHFNYDEVIPCAGNEVVFESQSAVPDGGLISAYGWEFGNATTDVGIVGSTVFETLGTESVLHIVSTTDGCVDSLEVSVVVLGSPVVEFSFDTVCVGGPTSFQEFVDVSESGPVFYQWQFGDGFFSNFPNTSHEYASPGIYQVTLTATGNDFGNAGCMDTKSQMVRVFMAPEAEIVLEDGCLDVGAELIDVTVASVVGGAVDQLSERTWEVVVGPNLTEEVGTDSVSNFQPDDAGVYTILYGFETEAGCIGATNGTVEVLAIPQSDFILDVPTGAPPVSAEAENISVDASAYEWWMDDAVVSTEENPLLFFPDTGDYVVSLVATNALGCADSSAQSYTLIIPEYDIAIIDITFLQQGGRLALTALLTNYGNTPITTFDLEVQIGQSINFTEHVEELIEPGELVYYALDPDFQYVPGRILPYTCMTVSNPNGVGDDELDLENNSMCIGLDKERVTFIAPFPNPVSDVLYLEFVLPRHGDMEIAFVDAEGREIMGRTYTLEQGYSRVEVDVSGLAEGVYLVRYRFDGEEEVERIVVAR